MGNSELREKIAEIVEEGMSNQASPRNVADGILAILNPEGKKHICLDCADWSGKQPTSEVEWPKERKLDRELVAIGSLYEANNLGYNQALSDCLTVHQQIVAQKDKEIEELKGENKTLREQNLAGCKENQKYREALKEILKRKTIRIVHDIAKSALREG